MANVKQTRGLDVYHGDGVIDWRQVQASGIEFAYVKTGEHETPDALFPRNWETLGEIGLTRGAYFYFHPNIDAEAQAEWFLSVCEPDARALPPAIDLETVDGLRGPTTAEDALKWLTVVEGAWGRECVVYVSPGFYEQYLTSGAAELGKRHLWVAHYGVPKPRVPAAWSAWLLWQHSETGSVPGCPGAVDLDVACGTHAQFLAHVGVTTP